MVYEYHTVTADDEFLLSVMINFIIYNSKILSHFCSPEEYRSDFFAADNVPEIRRRQIWNDINSAAESGWDFSSRWLSNSKTMDTIETSNIVPVDLNALMCWNMEILAHLHGEIGK
ncbi:unnamed protein product [Brugia pahangi]|uniref:Trehalase n=1 Tax=Brugia pahangi TaxID=6280 RepID=A0A0N4TFB8_BRUPA|nr:unnamed protein product [Brugia pahangi]